VRERLACQPEPQAMVTATPSPQSNGAMQASEPYTATAATTADQFVQPVNVDVLISSPAYQSVQAKAVAAPALITQPVVGAEVSPHTASIASTAVTESLCSLPSVSQYTNALFAELLKLLPSVPTQPAGNAMSVAKTAASAEVMQGPQVPQVPQLPATTALASSISWPGQPAKPIVGSTQPSPPSVASATSANAVTTATSAFTQVNTPSVGTSTAPTAAVSANPVAVSAVANPTQPVVIVKQYQKSKPYSGQTSHKSFQVHFKRVAKANNW